MTWPEAPFETLYAVPSRNGVYKPKEFHGRGCRIVNMGELFGLDFISTQDMERIDLSDAEKATSLLEDGDLLFGRRSLVEAGAGKCSLVVHPGDPLTFESSIIRVRVRSDLVDPRFLYYYFRSPQGRGRIRSIVSGTNVKGIRGSDLKGLMVAFPSPPTQRTIADNLSVYDNLIENNRRRMALLEDALRQVYREWFVRFRFPGREHTRIISGLPEGWKRMRIGDVADCVGGGTPPTAVPHYWEDGEITWITPTDVTRNAHLVLLDSAKKITEAGLQNSSAKLVPPHAVLMTSRASVGFFAVAGREVCTNQGFISVVAHEPMRSPYFLFHLSERVEEIRAMGSGSTYPEVSRGKFRELEVMLPAQTLVTAFCAQVTDVLKLIRILKQQNEKLRAARDLLLPRLMNGDVVVNTTVDAHT